MGDGLLFAYIISGVVDNVRVCGLQFIHSISISLQSIWTFPISNHSSCTNNSPTRSMWGAKFKNETRWKELKLKHKISKHFHSQFLFWIFCLLWIDNVLHHCCHFSSIKFNEKFANGNANKMFVRAIRRININCCYRPSCDTRYDIIYLQTSASALATFTIQIYKNERNRKKKKFIWVNWLIVFIVLTQTNTFSLFFFFFFICIPFYGTLTNWKWWESVSFKSNEP